MQIKTLIILFFICMVFAEVESKKKKKKLKGCEVNSRLYKKNKTIFKNTSKCLMIKCKREKGSKLEYAARTTPIKNCECNTIPCPDYCTLEHEPVCASDGIIYSNLCLMEVEACFSPGIKEAANPKSCQTCPPSCPKKYVPVCGSDGTLYDNACKLQDAACQTSGLKEASDQSTCQSCPQFCSTEYNPVCASNGVTFSNPCELQRYTCTKDSTVTLALDPNTCGDLCPVCPTLADPVCGSDDITYINECSLMSVVKPCGSKDIKISYNEPCYDDCRKSKCGNDYKPICGSDGVIYDNLCTFYNAVCSNYDSLREAEDPATCQYACPTCGPMFAPVCGSNGITYNNECELNSVARPCGDLSISLASAGPCKADCQSNVCSAEYNPICGSDGVLYGNQCELKVAACKNPSLTQADSSTCQAQCPTCVTVYAPVCGTNGITYDSECELKKIARPCGGVAVDVASVGICAADCTNPACTSDSVPVCGSDGIFYGDLCALKVAICSNSGLTQAVDANTCTGTGKRRKRDGVDGPLKGKKQKHSKGKKRKEDGREEEKKKPRIPNKQRKRGGRINNEVQDNAVQSTTQITKKPQRNKTKSARTPVKTNRKLIKSDRRKKQKKCTYNGKSYYEGQTIKPLHSYCLVMKCGRVKNKPVIVFEDLKVSVGQVCECKKKTPSK